MLVRLFGRNYRSLKEYFDLSLVAADLRREEDKNRGVIEAKIAGGAEPLRLLRSVAIYGPNASGKSNVLYAARALNWLAIDSSPKSRRDENIPVYDPFLLDEKTRKAPIELGCDVTHGNSILRYAIEFNEKKILGEILSVIDENQEIRLIERHPSGEVLGDLITRSAANQLYVREMQPNVSVLSKLGQHGPKKGKDSVQTYYRAVQNATRHKDYSEYLVMSGLAEEKFAKDPGYREWIMRHFIQASDLGICDVKTHTVRYGKIPIPEFTKVTFVHEGNINKPIDFSKESSGTKKLFNIAADWWTLANEPMTLFANELESGIHPRLLDRIIRAVNSPQEPIVSQLIFATHETGLLESQDGLPPALRRDQIYFTKKDPKGATELYSLAEFKEDARPVHNIRKRYLSGLYGAIPAVEKLTL